MQVYKYINEPLRRTQRSPHPLPATTKLLSEAIANLRAATNDVSGKPAASSIKSPSSPLGRKRKSSLLSGLLGAQPLIREHSVEGCELAESASRKRSSSAYYSMNLWRGMADVVPTGDFLQRGGTEASPLSSTRDPLIALKYAIRKSKTGQSTLLKLETENFMTRGVDLSFVSAFPAESEYL